MFYVYEWFINETYEVFYVGKGTGNRRFETHNRNKYFKNVLNKHNCSVRLVEQGLTNQEACELERERIAELWVINQAKCNLTSGGTGFSEGALNPRRLKPLKGKDNPMYNVHLTGEKNPFYGKQHSQRTKDKISASRKGKGARFGKDNPMYGKGFKGEENPMYGKRGKEHPNSRMYLVTYTDGSQEELHAKACELKFGIAFERVRKTGGTLHYKKKTSNMVYEGTNIQLI